MMRKIIHIDEKKCNGCGLCAQACQEGAIGLVDGKARLLREDYCDGLGNCLPVCPTEAISFIEREADAFDAQAVQAHMQQSNSAQEKKLPCGCPGSLSKTIARSPDETECCSGIRMSSQLCQWPVQIKLVPPTAPYFQGADLLVAADCTAYAYANFHPDFIRGHITLIGCPKLDAVDYSPKLTEILRSNDIRSLLVVRMDVPCCSGIEHAVCTAAANSGKQIPVRVCVVSSEGQLLQEREVSR